MKQNYKGIFILFFLSLFGGRSGAQCNYTVAVPYFESFESISTTNQLPACWSSSSPSVTCLTYTSSMSQNRVPRTGNKFASFYSNPAGIKYFYSNGILLNAGATYSLSVWYTTEYYGYNNWTDLSVLIGTSQSTTGQVVIASASSPVISNIYKSLSNTFTVPTTGIYYAAIRATNNNTCCAEYLSFDDFEIEQSCNVSLSVAASATSMCVGNPITFTVSGADTYTWSNGTTGPVATYTAAFGNSVSVAGTQTLSGCSSATTINWPVNPSPNVYVFSTSLTICSGDSTNLHATGASYYTWGPNQPTASVLMVSPTVTTVYTVAGTNQYGCTSSTMYTVTVLPRPVITISPSPGTNTVCSGDEVHLTGSGASTYTWVTATGMNFGNPVTITPTITTTFTVEGKGTNGCENSTSYAVTVTGCAGLDQLDAEINRLLVYPNPSSDEFTVELKNGQVKFITISDFTGRILFSCRVKEDNVKIPIKVFPDGIYFLAVRSDGNQFVERIVKQ